MVKEADVHLYLDALKENLKMHYRDRLVSLAVFGSLARETFRESCSDIDLLVVLTDPLPSHFKRNKEFMEAEGNLSETPFSDLLSPVIRSVREIRSGTPLMLDMTVDIIIKYDQNGILVNALNDLKKRLHALNSRRVFRGDKWYWILKPDIKWGENYSI